MRSLSLNFRKRAEPGPGDMSGHETQGHSDVSSARASDRKTGTHERDNIKEKPAGPQRKGGECAEVGVYVTRLANMVNLYQWSNY